MRASRSAITLTLGTTAWWATPARPCRRSGRDLPRRITGAPTCRAAKPRSRSQGGEDRRHVGDLALGQVAGLRPRVGDQLLALAVVQLLRDR